MTRFMTREHCDGCIWQGCCEFTAPCDFFTPVDDLDDSELMFQIEIGREQYRHDFRLYLEDREG